MYFRTQTSLFLYKGLLTLLTLLVFSVSISAQNDGFEMEVTYQKDSLTSLSIEEVVVTANRNKFNVISPMPTQVLSGQELSKLNSLSVADAIRYFSGVQLKDYGVFGGVPFYADRIDDELSFKENVISLLIEEGAIFEDEVSFFLSQEVRSVATYGKVLNAIASGATRVNEISTKSGISDTGNTSKHLDLLIKLGIVEKIHSFGESANSRKSTYKIKDQLFMFNYRFLERHRTQKTIMNPEAFYEAYIEPHLNEFISFEFERISMEFLLRKYKNSIQEISSYWHNNAKLKQNIEIDVVMKKGDELYAFECKWTNQPIDKKNEEIGRAHV